MLSDSIFSLRIVNARREQFCNNQGMEWYTFPPVVCQNGG